jgi:succinyl-CoA synthetase beta subunit
MIQQFISQIYRFFTTYGFSYLEFNPFVIMDGQIKVLDAVAKVDSCESYRQKQHW